MIELLAFFFIGLTGGFGHCVLMCNPFVLYISSKYSVSYSGYSMLIPHLYYNFGRTITYTILGAVAGLMGSVIQYAGKSFIGIQKLAAIMGGLFLVIFALFSFIGITMPIFSKFNISKFTKYFESSNPFFLGLMLGLLPCGLSMGTIIGAASSENAVKGAFMLFLFGIGTTVSMMVMALFGNLAIKHSNVFRKIGNILLLFTGIYFVYMGIRF